MWLVTRYDHLENGVVDVKHIVRDGESVHGMAD